MRVGGILSPCRQAGEFWAGIVSPSIRDNSAVAYASFDYGSGV